MRKPTREEVERCKQGIYDYASGIITDVKIKEIWNLIDALLDENEQLKEVVEAARRAKQLLNEVGALLDDGNGSETDMVYTELCQALAKLDGEKDVD